MNNLYEGQGLLRQEKIGEQAVVLKGFAISHVQQVLALITDIEKQSPFRHMMTTRGFIMSVGLTNCGKLGWVSDRKGYRYTQIDPLTNQPWPKMPEVFLSLAKSAAFEAGFVDFIPDACLINRYAPGTKLSLHQDKDEPDLDAPIVSVSLGIPAIFQFGGFERTDKKIKVLLSHGDVVVWGGIDRLRFHGVSQIKAATHSILGEQRINLTFRKAS